MTFIIDPGRIDTILERGNIAQVLPSKDALKRKLLSGERLRFYCGFDATAPSLHLGHARNVMLLESFRKLGHEAIVLFGDFTARIGDPSGRETARPQLSREEVLRNVSNWKRLIEPLIDFHDGDNPALIRYNHDWLSQLRFEDVVNLASHFTVQQIIERDMFQKRLAAEKPIHLHEFLYPIMQGYDSVALDVDVELCGTDQIFNAMAGRTLLHKLKDKEKFVVATTLIANPKTGVLMSKSKGTGIFLDVSAEDMFGQIMAQPDEMIEILFVNNTRLALEEIKLILNENNPKKAKTLLAHEIVAIYHGEAQAEAAQNFFIAAFEQKEIPTTAPVIKAVSEAHLGELLVKEGAVRSKADFKRLIDEGAIASDGEKIGDYNYRISKSAMLKIGKHKFLKIVVN